MSKLFFFSLVVLTVLLGYIFGIDIRISKYYFQITDSLKKSYLQASDSIIDKFELYFNQVQTIKELKEKVDNNQNYKLLYNASNEKLQKILKDINGSSNFEFNSIFTTVVSYTNLNDYSKVILDKTIPKNKIFPIISGEGFAAGIAINYEDRSIGLLNNNEKCNYAVFIGKQNAPGITSGIDKNGNIIIKYIPIWFTLNKNDEVITSGMDRIFPTGIKVGRILSVKKLINTKEAYVKPYTNVLTKKHFFMIKKK